MSHTTRSFKRQVLLAAAAITVIAGYGSLHVSLASATAVAAADFLGTIAGSWQGKGKFMGAAATGNLQIENTLNGKFRKLTQRISFSAGGKEQMFEGHAYYLPDASGKTTATWFDVEGNVYAINSTISADRIKSVWGKPGSVKGSTDYIVLSGNRLLVVDSVPNAQGKWSEFGRIEYEKRQ